MKTVFATIAEDLPVKVHDEQSRVKWHEGWWCWDETDEVRSFSGPYPRIQDCKITGNAAKLVGGK